MELDLCVRMHVHHVHSYVCIGKEVCVCACVHRRGSGFKYSSSLLPAHTQEIGTNINNPEPGRPTDQSAQRRRRDAGGLQRWVRQC